MTGYETLRVEETHAGRRLAIVLDGGKGNVIDTRMSRELTHVLRTRTGGRHLCGVTLGAEGKHFSFGASVPEHAPEFAADLLTALHDAVIALLRCPVPSIAAVRGACLGGALELILPCQRIIAAPGAKLGQPEVTLGMYAPAGSVLLPRRVGRGLAQDMLLTGRVVTAEEALAKGLVDQLDEDPDAAALAWFDSNLAPRSASAVRFSTAAAAGDVDSIEASLRNVERTFIEKLMKTEDAREGVRSFVDKRPPVWVDA